jgi:hypothetical protein
VSRRLLASQVLGYALIASALISRLLGAPDAAGGILLVLGFVVVIGSLLLALQFHGIRRS